MLWTYARLTGLLLSIEPLADEVRVDSCYDRKDKVEYNSQSSHLLSVMSDWSTGSFIIA